MIEGVRIQRGHLMVAQQIKGAILHTQIPDPRTPRLRLFSSLALLSAALMLNCGGCYGEQPEPMGSRPPHEAVTPEPALVDGSAPSVRPAESIETSDGLLTDFDIFPVDERIFISDGLSDSTNRYSSTVMVAASTPLSGPTRCNGVIIAPRLVLTAGHCVCHENQVTPSKGEARTIIDASDCVEYATVTTAIYSSSKERIELLLGAQHEKHRGKVRPHPNLKIVLDDHAATLSSTADLAVILLDHPVSTHFQPAQLAKEAAQAGESVIIVGYGQDETSELILGVRRFGNKKITGSSDEGGFLERQGLPALNSGSGEPCLRQGGKNVMLVGLAGRYSGDKPTFMSVPFYRTWLISEIRRAANADAEESSP
jgi:hypothetical protein